MELARAKHATLGRSGTRPPPARQRRPRSLSSDDGQVPGSAPSLYTGRRGRCRQGPCLPWRELPRAPGSTWRRCVCWHRSKTQDSRLRIVRPGPERCAACTQRLTLPADSVASPAWPRAAGGLGGRPRPALPPRWRARTATLSTWCGNAGARLAFHQGHGAAKLPRVVQHCPPAASAPQGVRGACRHAPQQGRRLRRGGAAPATCDIEVKPGAHGRIPTRGGASAVPAWRPNSCPRPARRPHHHNRACNETGSPGPGVLHASIHAPGGRPQAMHLLST